MKNIYKFGFNYLKLMRLQFICFIILSCIYAAFTLIAPYVSGVFVDSLIKMTSIYQLYRYCLIFALLSIGSVVLAYITNVISTSLLLKSSNDLINQFLKHIRKIPISILDRQDSAYMSQLVNRDANTIMTFIIQSSKNIILNILQLVISIIMLLTFNIQIGIVFSLLIILYAIIYKFYRKKLYVKSYNMKQSQTKYFRMLYENISTVRFVRTHSLHNFFDVRFHNNFLDFFNNSMVSQKANYTFASVDQLIMVFAQILLFIIGGKQVINGELSIGNFTIIITYFNMIMSSVRYFYSLGQNVQDTLVSLNRLLSVFNIQEEENGKFSLGGVKTIQLKNIMFSYDDKIVLNNFSYCFSTGKIYCLSGKNGKGKSSLISILLGLNRERYSGDIIINGKTINQIDILAYCKNNISYLEQEPVVIEDTIKYNIAFEKELDLNNVVLDLFSFKSFVENLQDGFNTIINENSTNISGGEKKKIALIRTFVKNNDFIILDEPSTALDEQSKQELIRYLDKIKHERIILIVSHDKDFVKISDEIIEL